MSAILALAAGVYLLAFALRRIVGRRLNKPLSVILAFGIAVVGVWIFEQDALFFRLGVVWLGAATLVFGALWSVLDAVRQENVASHG